MISFSCDLSPLTGSEALAPVSVGAGGLDEPDEESAAERAGLTLGMPLYTPSNHRSASPPSHSIASSTPSSAYAAAARPRPRASTACRCELVTPASSKGVAPPAQYRKPSARFELQRVSTPAPSGGMAPGPRLLARDVHVQGAAGLEIHQLHPQADPKDRTSDRTDRVIEHQLAVQALGRDGSKVLRQLARRPGQRPGKAVPAAEHQAVDVLGQILNPFASRLRRQHQRGSTRVGARPGRTRLGARPGRSWSGRW